MTHLCTLWRHKPHVNQSKMSKCDVRPLSDTYQVVKTSRESWEGFNSHDQSQLFVAVLQLVVKVDLYTLVMGHLEPVAGGRRCRPEPCLKHEVDKVNMWYKSKSLRLPNRINLNEQACFSRRSTVHPLHFPFNWTTFLRCSNGASISCIQYLGKVH